ncbi:MAG: PIG-L deacetylase family protein [Sphingobium sp.]
MSSMLDCISRALVIAPHPDDEVLGCGGTMMRLARAGAEVHVAIVTKAGTGRFGPDTAATGRSEAREAHALLHVARTHFIDLPAAELDRVAHADMNAAMGALVAEVAPDTLFVPFVGDVHLDHQLTFLSAMVAARPRGGKGPLRIYSYETLSETNWYAPGVTPAFIPNVYVDISDTLETKIEAFNCYRSQVKQAPDERSPEIIRALSHFRGATVHRFAAETFMLIRQIE